MVIIEADDKRNLTFKTEEAPERIGNWLKQSELQMAPQKAEGAILKGHHSREALSFVLFGNGIGYKWTIQYLGVILDYGPHIDYVSA